jgi:hypothetical protein
MRYSDEWGRLGPWKETPPQGAFPFHAVPTIHPSSRALALEIGVASPSETKVGACSKPEHKIAMIGLPLGGNLT